MTVVALPELGSGHPMPIDTDDVCGFEGHNGSHTTIFLTYGRVVEVGLDVDGAAWACHTEYGTDGYRVGFWRGVPALRHPHRKLWLDPLGVWF